MQVVNKTQRVATGCIARSVSGRELFLYPDSVSRTISKVSN